MVPGLFQSDLPALLLGGEKIRLHIQHCTPAAEPDAVFKVEEEAAVIHIHRTHGSVEVVGDNILGVEEAGGIFKYPHPSLQ